MSIHKNLELIKAVALHKAKEHGCNYNIILMNPDNGMFKEGSSTYEFVRDSYFEKERTNCILLHKTDDLIKKSELVVLGHVGAGRSCAMALHEKAIVLDNLNELLDIEMEKDMAKKDEVYIYENPYANLPNIDIPPLTKKEQNQVIVDVRNTPKINRNSICTCGSGKKFKNCCLKKLKDENNIYLL